MTAERALFVANPGLEYQEDREALLSLMAQTLDRGVYILGQEVEAFEKEFATYLGVKHAIGVANGTDAISYALKALDIGPGDEVVTVSHSAVATVAAIELTGAEPVFADIDPVTRCMCPESLSRVISKKTKAIVVVHIYGHSAEMDRISQVAEQASISLIEDCAQAHGATFQGKLVGSIAPLAAFSFYPTKNLGALGDGGGIAVRDNEEFAHKIQALRQYGWKERYVSSIPGGNSRLDELQAAILRYRLTQLPKRNARRLEIARHYNETFQDLPITLPHIPEQDTHAFHQYVIETPERDALKAFLAERGVHAALHYPLAIHQQPAYRGRIRGSDELPVTEKLYREILSLPVYPQLSPADVERIAALVRAFWSK